MVWPWEPTKARGTGSRMRIRCKKGFTCLGRHRGINTRVSLRQVSDQRGTCLAGRRARRWPVAATRALSYISPLKEWPSLHVIVKRNIIGRKRESMTGPPSSSLFVFPRPPLSHLSDFVVNPSLSHHTYNVHFVLTYHTRRA